MKVPANLQELSLPIHYMYVCIDWLIDCLIDWQTPTLHTLHRGLFSLCCQTNELHNVPTRPVKLNMQSLSPPSVVFKRDGSSVRTILGGLASAAKLRERAETKAGTVPGYYSYAHTLLDLALFLSCSGWIMVVPFSYSRRGHGDIYLQFLNHASTATNS